MAAFSARDRRFFFAGRHF
jgi:hypothetical protein